MPDPATTTHDHTATSTDRGPDRAGGPHGDATHQRGRHARHVEVLVVGGGPAGLAAALSLGRSRRDVLVVDDGEPRNAPAAAMHAFLTRDGTPPGELAELARQEVAVYGVVVEAGRVTQVARAGRRFRVGLADSTVVLARRLVVTTGLHDELPEVDGLAEHWGGDVVHCPYCHGWEVRDRTIGVLATSPAAMHQAGLFRQLSDHVVLLTHTGPAVTDEQAERLGARGIDVVDGHVTAVSTTDGRLSGVTLDDGRQVALEALAVAPSFVARAGFLADLGLEAVEHPSGMGHHVPSDPTGRSAVDGVWLAGNVTDPMVQVVAAAAQGNMAGAMVNADLVEEETERAVAAAALPEDAAEWDDLYTAEGDGVPSWSGEPNGALVAEVGGLAPGTALDVGCGEGADAVWLARQGWQVTGLDPSRVALDRADAAAREAGVDVALEHADLVAFADAGRTFDLVSAQYPAVRHHDGGAARALLDTVPPGGTLLVVHHEVDHDHAAHHGFDPSEYVQPDDLAAHLDGDTGWTVEVHERRPRPGCHEHHPVDVVLRARRRT